MRAANSNPSPGTLDRNSMGTQPSGQYRFGLFLADANTGELHKQGLRIRLHAQPFQILLLLLARPGHLLTREEICSELWPDGTFVDYEHGVNSAVNRIREAIGDRASNPRFIETLARRGYRFIAPVARVAPYDDAPEVAPVTATSPDSTPVTPLPLDTSATSPMVAESTSSLTHTGPLQRFLAGPSDLPQTPHALVLALFVSLQAMYLAFYVAALANLGEISDLLASLGAPAPIFPAVLVSAALLIPVRVFLICAALFRAPAFANRFSKLWPFLLAADALWSLSPFLLLHHMSAGLGLACTTVLLYAPFAQRSLIVMGAGSAPGAATRAPS